jgi:transcriptional regulator with XRE-family HTH domain
MTTKQLTALRSMPVTDIGNRLSAAFDLTGQSQAECVRKTRFTPQYVSDMVRGRFKNISVDNAREFAEFFGCQIEDLFPSREAVA